MECGLCRGVEGHRAVEAGVGGDVPAAAAAARWGRADACMIKVGNSVPRCLLWQRQS